MTVPKSFLIFYGKNMTQEKHAPELEKKVAKDVAFLSRNIEHLSPENSLEGKIRESYATNTPLRIKLGFDPTAPDLHLGHYVVLKKMREFQDLGHTVVIIIGDFTACIGDPTGKNKTRPPLAREEVLEHAKTYLDQLGKIIDLSKAEIHPNSTWFDTLTLRETIRLLAKMTLSQILQREDFHNRYKNNTPIFFHELIYPMVQGYDSLMIDSDIEMGGTDQLFNCLVGRDIQGAYNKKQQIVITVPLLRGTDGEQKMSKSLKNYVGITEDPHNMYGKLMSIPDKVISEYARLVSNFSNEQILHIEKALEEQSQNPMEIKKQLAHNIVEQFHGKEAADESADFFYKQVQSRDDTLIEFQPMSISSLGLDPSQSTLLHLCSSLEREKSKSEVRRLIEGGGVTINGEKATDPFASLHSLSSFPFKIKIGKRAYFEIRL